MEVWYIIPIGGILAVFGVLLVTLLYGLWVTASENSDVLISFANQHTDIFLIVFAVIALLIAVAATAIYLSERKDKSLLGTIPVGLSYGVPAFLYLGVIYDWTINWITEYIESMVEVLIVALMLLPVFLFVWLAFLVIALIPLALFIPAVAKIHQDGFWQKVYPCIAGIITTAIYIIYINSQTDLWEFFLNSIH